MRDNQIPCQAFPVLSSWPPRCRRLDGPMPAKSRMRNIQRVDHHHFHGWHVCFKRAGTRHEKSFRDDPDRKSSLATAIRWRDEMVETLPPPRKFKRRYVLNNTGVIGVHLARTRTRKGTRVFYYCATWIDDRGRSNKRSYSLAKYGEPKARSLAVRTRREALADLLRPSRPPRRVE